MPRALTQSEIQKKRNFIIKQAIELFQDCTFRSFKMEELAKRCAMSKGIIFKYFTSKEHLFLLMLQKEFEHVFDHLDQEMRQQDEMTYDEFKEFILSNFKLSLEPKRTLIRLLAIKGAIIDANLSTEYDVRYRKHLNDLLVEYAQNIMLKVSGVSLKQLLCTFRFEIMLSIGFINTYLNDETRDIIESEDLDTYLYDCKEISIKALTYYLDNLQE